MWYGPALSQMSDGGNDDATHSCFIRLRSVSLQHNQVNSRVSSKNSCSQSRVVSNRNANVIACVLRRKKVLRTNMQFVELEKREVVVYSFELSDALQLTDFSLYFFKVHQLVSHETANMFIFFYLLFKCQRLQTNAWRSKLTDIIQFFRASFCSSIVEKVLYDFFQLYLPQL